MLESKEVGVDTSSFLFPIRLCGFGGRVGETKVRRRRRKRKKEYHENFKNALRCIRPRKVQFLSST